ncbi:hypothetical protein OH492_27345 [Vibrio chagasii]|nr:hypothetical protein [Vibrio chagasii]
MSYVPSIVILQHYKAQGAEIDGEAGVGYLLQKPTFYSATNDVHLGRARSVATRAEWVAKQANGSSVNPA